MAKKKVMLVDLDDTIVDFSGGFYKAWHEKYPNIKILKPENRKSWDFADDLPEKLHDKMNAIIYSPNFCLNLEPIPGALKALEELSVDYEVFICSAPLINSNSCHQDKKEWLVKQFKDRGEYWARRLILTKDKTLVRGNFLIDDKPEVTGHYKPEWEHILFAAPFNAENRRGKYRLEGWTKLKSMLSYLKYR